MTAADFRAALEHVRSRAADYGWLWEQCAKAPDIDRAFASLRERVDPERPFFFGELSNGIRFAGDARDFPAALHALYADCNSTLIRGLEQALDNRTGQVIDVGANLGVVSAALARRLGTRGEIVAIEPSPPTALVAAATLALNEVDNVRLLQVAASDAAGEITFHVAPGNSAVASVIQHGFPHLNSWSDITVQGLPLDALELEHVTLIKIDVEGHEAAVLRGARETIAKCAPIVIYEFTPVVAEKLGWSCEASMEAVKAGRPYTFRALTEPPLHVIGAQGRWIDFPLPKGVRDQVNVFAHPA